MNENDNQKAINAVFGTKTRLKKILDDAFGKWEENLEDDTSFEDAMGQFCYELDSIATEQAAQALGVDITHYYVREHRQMESGDLQRFIDDVGFKDFDHLVNKLLAALHKGDQTAAQAIFTDIFPKLKTDFPRMTRADFKAYLIAVNDEMSGEQGINDAIENLCDDTPPDSTTSEAAPAPMTGRMQA